MPASTAQSDLTTEYVATYNWDTDTIMGCFSPTTADGTYGYDVFRGGTWATGNTGNLLALYCDKSASGVYTVNSYVLWNQMQTTTSRQLTNSNGTARWRGIIFGIGPTFKYLMTTNYSETKKVDKDPVQYRLGRAGAYYFCNLYQYRNLGDNQYAVIANFLPATDGTYHGYLDVVSNTFYPVDGAEARWGGL
jgi:hypothetical protein